MNFSKLRYAAVLMIAVFGLPGILHAPAWLARFVASVAVWNGMRDMGGDPLKTHIGYRLVVAIVCSFVVFAILKRATEAEMDAEGESDSIVSRGWSVIGNVISEHRVSVSDSRAWSLYLKAYGCLYLFYCIVYGGAIVRDPSFSIKLFFLFPLEMVGGDFGSYLTRIIR